MFKYVTSFILIIAIFLMSVTPSSAVVQFELIPPSGQLVRGQDIQFSISIEATGETVTAQQIGISFEPQYLQYLGVVPGNAMTTVTATDLGGGRIVLSGSNPSGFTGEGIFANVNFKIIADAPGETEVCTLWNPQATPSPSLTPTTSVNVTPAPTCIPQPGGTVMSSPPYCPLAPVYLPSTGNSSETSRLALWAGGFLLGGAGLFMIKKYLHSHHHEKK